MSLILKNISYNFLGQIWTMGISLFTLPIIVHKLGADGYGVLALAEVISGYFMILDLGLNVAFVKYVSQFYAARDMETIKKICNTGLVVYGLLGVVGCVVFLAISDILAKRVLNIPAALESQAVLVFRLAAFAFLVDMTLAIFTAIPDAVQRFDLTNKRNIIIGSLGTFGTIGLLYAGQGLVPIMLLTLGLNILALLLFVRISGDLLDGMAFRPSFDRAVFKMLFRFSVFRFVSAMNVIAVGRLDKFIIGVFLPIQFVTYYTVAQRVIQRIFFLLSNNILRALFPVVSGQTQREDALREIYVRCSRIIFATSLLVAIIFLVFADQILRLWMGAEFASKAAPTMRLLTVGYLLISTANTPGSFTDAVGRPDINAWFGSFNTFLMILLLVIFVPTLGLIGAPLALIVDIFAQQPFFIAFVNRKVFKISNYIYAKECYSRPLLVGACVAALLSLLLPFTLNLAALLASVAVGSLLYVALSFALGSVGESDRRSIKRYLEGSHLGCWRKLFNPCYRNKTTTQRRDYY